MTTMHRTLPDSLLEPLSHLLAECMGLGFPEERWGDLERGIAAAAPLFAAPDARACAQRLLSAPLTHCEIERLASCLTVGETYFFREPRSFEVFERHILPELLHSREHARRLRLWSAGCCTGEEPYSIAMLLDRLIPDLGAWNTTLRATDINPEFLRKAARGVYGEWSFRGTPDWVRARWFRRTRAGRYTLDEGIRRRVNFSILNLADDSYPSLTSNTNAMDVIFCRNVLMYFTAERARKVIENFHRALVDGGWLIVSPTETSASLFSGFTAVEFPGAVLYRKLAGAAPRRVVPGYPAPVFAVPPENLKPPEPAMFPEPVVAQAMESAPATAAEPGAALASKQDDPRAAPALMARACANQGRLAEAVAWCEQAIAADKLNPACQYLLATIQQEQGQGDAAAQSLTRALYLDPDFVLAHFALGNLRLAQGRHREAQRHFDTALALLHAHPHGEPLPESEGLTAGRLTQIISSVRASLPRAVTGT
jgi:chemotaxis protein methyltransferase CheR